MRLYSTSLPLERAQPWLGTLVAIRVDRCRPGTHPHAAISHAFKEVARVHALMSFRETDSDVVRLNREAHRRAMRVDGHTLAVIRAAQALSLASEGAFDITLAGRWVGAGLLPSPTDAPLPDPAATFRDVQMEGDKVRFLRPLWIELGGIAKGYAADCAAAALRRHGVLEGRVDAGGDLVTLGRGPHCIVLHDGNARCDTLALVEIGEGAVATSSNRCEVRSRNGQVAVAHWDGRHANALQPSCSVSVLAPEGLYADALTKVVMAMDRDARPVLARYDAVAYLHDDLHGWRSLETAA